MNDITLNISSKLEQGASPSPSGNPVDPKTLADDFRSCGWVKFNIDQGGFPLRLLEEFMAFSKHAIMDLNPDPYDRSGLRKRRYGTFICVPSIGTLVPVGRWFDSLGVAKSNYFQPASYQPEEGDMVRRFDALTERQISSPVLKELIEMDWRIAAQSGRLPEAPAYFVGVHIIKLEPWSRKLSAVTPNTIHRDGEPVTFAHLLGQRNVEGGWNAITPVETVNKHPDELGLENVLARFTLTDPGESYAVDDRSVAHYVEGVGLIQKDEWGHRTVALIDFCPARRVYSDDLDNMTFSEKLDLKQ